jgi:hypothetical protein
MSKSFTFTVTGWLMCLILPLYLVASPGNSSVPSGIYNVPYFQDFNGSNILPDGWGGAMEVLSLHGVSATNALAFNLYDDPSALTCNAVSPQVLLSGLPCRMAFSYRIADWNNYPVNPTVLGPNDKIEVRLSSDTGLTYTTQYTINSLNHAATSSFSEVILDLSGYNGLIMVKFVCTWGSGDYYVDIDDFLVEEIPVCSAPYNLVATNISGNSLETGWNGAALADIDYGFEGHQAGTGTMIAGISANPYTITGLSALTSYDIFVRQNCGNGINSGWTGPLTVTTSDVNSLVVNPFTSLNGTGYVSNQSYTKMGADLQVSTAINDTCGRGFMKFDLSGLPAGAVITSATLLYFNHWREGASSALNSLYPLTLDPQSASGTDLYSDCGDGPVLWSGVWSGSAPVWIESALNEEGINYLNSQINAGWAGFGIVRSATALFAFSGYDKGDLRPGLRISYHIPSTPVISVLPSSHDFQQVHVGFQSDTKEFAIKNIGAGILNISSLLLSGTDAIHFILSDTSTYPVQLPSGSSYTVLVSFAPGSVGVKLCNLKAIDQDGEHLFPLTGTGYLNPPRNLIATPVEGSDVRLNWQPPIAPGANKVVGMTYTMHRGVSPGLYTHSVTGLSDTSYLDATTSQSTMYYYIVTAEYPNGSAPSNEVSVTTFPGCPPPTSPVVSGITVSAATLGWAANGATAWIIEWGPAGFLHGTGTMITTGVTNPYSLAGLTSGTSYDFYVRSDCGSGEYSDWAGPTGFTTLCPTVSAPFTEGFELPAFPPQCWSKTAGPPAWTRSFTVSAFGTGSGSALANFLNISQPTPFELMTFTFNATGLYQPLLKFNYAYATYSVEVDSLKLYYSTNGGATYTLLAGLAGGPGGILNTGGAVTVPFVPTSGQWGTYSVTLPPGTDKIRFTAISAWGNNLYIDNVAIEAGVPPVPENLSVSGLVSSGQTKCYNATQVITVAGSTTYTLQSGATANFIAGQKIRFMPGSAIKSGSYMHGYIAPGGPWCPLTPESGDQLALSQEEQPVTSTDHSFVLYPNPARESATLLFRGVGVHDRLEVAVFNMKGREVFSARDNFTGRMTLNMADEPAGIYLVKVLSGSQCTVLRLVKVQ